MSETTKTTAKKAVQTAAKQATHSTKNVELAAELATKSLASQAVRNTNLHAFVLGVVGTTVGHFAVHQAKAYLAKRRLEQEIAEATAETPSA